MTSLLKQCVITSSLNEQLSYVNKLKNLILKSILFLLIGLSSKLNILCKTFVIFLYADCKCYLKSDFLLLHNIPLQKVDCSFKRI